MPEKTEPVAVNVAVEGALDAAVIERLLQQADAEAERILRKGGKAKVLEALEGYNNAARHGTPWVVLVDLDRDAGCAPPYRGRILPDPAPLMCLRVAVREVEAWLLADRESLARFLKIPPAKIPERPEEEEDPKRTMVNLARQSRAPRIRMRMAPKEGGGNVGKAYTSLLEDYVAKSWSPARAARRADSLRRALLAIRRLGEALRKDAKARSAGDAAGA